MNANRLQKLILEDFFADTTLTPRQEKIIRSEQFKRWFGDWENDPKNASKVVDEEGKPLIVWHGTNEEFDEFDYSKGRSSMDIQGLFFSPWEIDAGGYGSINRQFFVNIRRPASERQAYEALKKFKYENYAGRKARELLIKQGYDGVIFNDEEIIAFFPNQVKSADKNSGAFDLKSPKFFN